MMTMRRETEPELKYQLAIHTAGLELLAVGSLTLAALAMVAPALLGATTGSLVLGCLVAAASLTGAVLFFQRAQRARRIQPQPIILRSDHMLLPKGRFHEQTYQVGYDWVSRYALNGTGSPRLTIELVPTADGTTFTFAQRDFAVADDFFGVIAALGRRIKSPGRDRAA
jgi:hypothetical protein